MPRRLTITEFIHAAHKIHGNKYDYSKVVYFNNSSQIEIVCNEHGSIWQRPNDHCASVAGCPSCGKPNKKLTTEIFTQRSNIIHNGKYDYSRVNYTNNSTKVEILCPKHGSFMQTPDNHMYGKGCILCSSNTSKEESQWLDSLSNPNLRRNYKIQLTGKGYFKADGFDPDTNTIYEYNGKYWHGHPDKGDPDDSHPKGGTYGDRYLDTLVREIRLKDMGYKVITKWN